MSPVLSVVAHSGRMQCVISRGRDAKPRRVLRPGQLSKSASGAFDALKVQLYRLGLLDDYDQRGCVYGVWPKVQA